MKRLLILIGALLSGAVIHVNAQSYFDAPVNVQITLTAEQANAVMEYVMLNQVASTGTNFASVAEAKQTAARWVQDNAVAYVSKEASDRAFVLWKSAGRIRSDMSVADKEVVMRALHNSRNVSEEPVE